MNGFQFLKTYCLTFLVFLAVDFLWLGLIAKKIYDQYLGHFLKAQVNWPAAFIFYLMYIAGIILFAVKPGLAEASLAKAASWGALFGFFTYATYDLTNLATLRDWPIKIVVVDILWGTLLCTLVASGSYMIGRWLSNS